jgi:hypothetical protein
MTEQEARNYLNIMMIALQRYRGINFETLLAKKGGLGFTKEQLGETWPWVFGEKCPLAALQKILDGDKVTGIDFYNMMFILDRFMPEIKIAGQVSSGIDCPDPNINWIKGLE